MFVAKGAGHMRLERVGEKQFRIFFTVDELEEIGLSPEEVDLSGEWENFFIDTIRNLKDEFNILEEGTIFIDMDFIGKQDPVFVMTIQTMEEQYFPSDWDETDESTDTLHYRFSDVEDVIQLAIRLKHDYSRGELYFFENRYHLILPIVCKDEYERLTAIIKEYGEPALQTIPYIQEYGKKLVDQWAIHQLNYFFNKT
ncbi:adaptor protein MecA [Fervidibacillus albus]|uniref:Adaptor protein MecA n=1 Tax=Fervidibacillus albus TaxID=2980026 RepID=A0A9E8LVW2_9BACI|nr:adaptor protein MecA [Fervidibacillus albus]WAA10534.1 adaptor protein MecA [Fervidibacillus albus]